jgi:hypothetical protein
MPPTHTIDELRSVLVDLRMAIETLEASLTAGGRPKNNVLKRLQEAKIQEAVILAKLAQAGVRV